MLSRIKTMWKLNEAAVVVQNLLELNSAGTRMNAKDLAYRWIAEINAEKPDLFNGRFGQRPHKISVAAVALAQGFYSEIQEVEALAHAAMGTLLTEICVNGRLYAFNSIDLTLLDAADKLFLGRLPNVDSEAA